MLDEAKRWFEASTVICRFVPDGHLRAEKVSASLYAFDLDTNHDLRYPKHILTSWLAILRALRTAIRKIFRSKNFLWSDWLSNWLRILLGAS